MTRRTWSPDDSRSIDAVPTVDQSGKTSTTGGIVELSIGLLGHLSMVVGTPFSRHWFRSRSSRSSGASASTAGRFGRSPVSTPIGATSVSARCRLRRPRPAKRGKPQNLHRAAASSRYLSLSTQSVRGLGAELTSSLSLIRLDIASVEKAQSWRQLYKRNQWLRNRRFKTDLPPPQ